MDKRRPSAPLESHMMLLCTPVQPAVLGVVSILQSTVALPCYGAGQMQNLKCWPLHQLAVCYLTASTLAYACVGFWLVMPCWPPCWPWCISFSTPAAERIKQALNNTLPL